MTQKELLESVLVELSSIKKGMPNGELKVLVEDMKEMKEDISELKYTLLNPEDGVVVKTNQNTYFRKETSELIKKNEVHIQSLQEVLAWKAGVTRALWIIFGIMAGIIIRILMMHSEQI